MQLFRPIEHAITDDGEWVTIRELPVDYMRRLKCDSCHASVVVIENKSGEEEFVHLRHNLQEITRTRSCRYALAGYRDGDKQTRNNSHSDSPHTTIRSKNTTNKNNAEKMALCLVRPQVLRN